MGQQAEEPVPLADLLRGGRGQEVAATEGLLLAPGHVRAQQPLVPAERGLVVAARRGQLTGQDVGRDHRGAGAVPARGYADTTARDIVAASGTNLASIGYHYGSTKALLNAAVLQALDEFGEQMAQAMGTGAVAGETTLERFERFWAAVIDSFATNRQVWLATFDIFTVAQRDPEVRAAVADGIEDARVFWAQALYGVDPADRQQARAVGSLHQALVSGVLVQWLIDPERAPSPAGLAAAMAAIAAQLTAETT